MGKEQINLLKAAIAPQYILPESEASDEIKICDDKQIQHASAIGSGHRVIYGVAGSGKTIMLIAKAKLLAANPKNKILFLCFNVTLSQYIKKQLADFPNVLVTHFHGWVQKQKVKTKKTKSKKKPTDFGFIFLKFLQNRGGDFGKYDAILIDEAQDFEPIWLMCSVYALKDRRDGDLVIVADGNQGIYRVTPFTWKDLGINAIGRTKYKKLDLDKNYRNTKEIFALATQFSTEGKVSEDDEVDLDNNEACISMRKGYLPIFYMCKSRLKENNRIIQTVKELNQGKLDSQKIAPLNWNEIAILYPQNQFFEKRIREKLLPMLKEICPQTIWITDPRKQANKILINEPGLKILTIWQTKGLQFKAVILMGIEQLPSRDRPKESNKLMYVALTRPTDYLILSCSNENSPFINKIEKSGFVEIRS